MIAKGYPHPLYSLTLITPADPPIDEPRYAIPAAGGRLMVRPELRKRGDDVTTFACEGAVCDALARHELHLDRFAEHGFTMEWNRNLRHWEERCRDQLGVRYKLDLFLKEEMARRNLLLWRGRDLWARVATAARLAGIDGTLTLGQRPEGVVPFIDALCQLTRRALAPEAVTLLQDHGLHPRYQDELRGVVEHLPRARDRIVDLEHSRRQAGDVMIVIRGAIVGDIGRLAQAAPHVAAEEHLRALRMTHLFPRRGRRRARTEQ